VLNNRVRSVKKQKIEKKRKKIIFFFSSVKVWKGHHTSELRKLRNQYMGLRKE